MSAPAIRVLMLEDNPVECALLRNLIRVAAPQRLADIAEVRSMDQALKRLAKNSFDLIVADLGLEDSRGPQTVMALRRAVRDTPIVVVTALDDYESGTQAIEHGAQDYLVKGQITERDLGRAMRFALTRKAIEDRLYNEKERARATLAAIAEAVVTTDASGAVVSLNSKAEALCGWSSQDAYGRPAIEVLALFEHGTYGQVQHPVEAVTRQRTSSGSIKGRYLMRSRDGVELIVDIAATAIIDRMGEIAGSVLILHDTTHDYEMLTRFSYQARHDALTGLANRYEFERNLRQLCADAAATTSVHALLYIDLDRFKAVNDAGGHAAGDELLRQLSQVLRSCVRRSDMVARLGGDEFGVLLEHCDLERAAAVARKIVQGINDYKLYWGGSTYSVGASIGVVDIQGTHSDATEVLCMADSASMRAKQAGRNQVNVHEWSPDSDWLAQSAVALEYALRNEINMALYAQLVSGPEPSSSCSSYCELVLRYLPEEGGVQSAANLLMAAQRLGLDEKLDRWIVNAAADAINGLRQRAPQAFEARMFGLDVSAASVSNTSMVAQIMERLAAHGVPAQRICFEIDELTLTTRPAQTAEFARALRANGFAVALDHFTGGAASFEYLRHVPINYIKLDSRLLEGDEDDGFDGAIVLSMREFARARGIQLICLAANAEAIVLARQRYQVPCVQFLADAQSIKELGSQFELTQAGSARQA
jgi:diguanylate cyclase (GGDEF)-like protein/PAS domain S-box-containing protein